MKCAWSLFVLALERLSLGSSICSVRNGESLVVLTVKMYLCVAPTRCAVGGGDWGCRLLCLLFRESLYLASSEVMGKYMVVLTVKIYIYIYPLIFLRLYWQLRDNVYVACCDGCLVCFGSEKVISVYILRVVSF